MTALETGPEPASDDPGFRVSLDGFDGPFDLLLTLIGKHELDITEVSLSLVTDEFIAYLATLEGQGLLALDQASEFLVVAATLLDMKIASLLPQGETVDPEDIALLEARDLLFARLLQYRAFKQASDWFRERLIAEEKRHPRQVPLEPKYRERGPELVWTLSLDDFAAVALLAFTPRELPTVGLDHLHAPLVSIREQAAIIVSMLRGGPARSFRELIVGVTEKGVIVARFLAILELYRRDAVLFDQAEPLGELSVQWSGEHWNDEELSTLGSDYD
ncbi:Segregation and condensation protein A [Leucobacter aridicollis]|uniref:Segregation and condensation protein A n=1 Tax=Leucobacter aridicollis TaxID=283878 RepID=A0A852RBC3_9MICO|nr:ScpA family protein [Leucobacter aridicollis]MBL3682260.1 segregation/condensation protein A [Leucobacter aridicollis]MCS3426375.1 segregation and condensation protein A [Leucobacter aridicollis]NYD25674.1 segregation and condensation protein A [Leucobacter aridicollis]RKQ89467.1 condensin subunit ScpA [Mycolicibacterium mucogenicum 261Sha1.1M5]